MRLRSYSQVHESHSYILYALIYTACISNVALVLLELI